MELLFSILSGVLVFVVIVSLFWTIIGIPVGIILLILKHANKFHGSKKKLFWWCFGGIISLIAAFVLFFIVSVIQGFLGISVATLPLPNLQ